MCNLQSEAQSVTEGDMGEEEDEEDIEEVDEEDGLKGDSVWDPDHATPWRPRRSRRNTSQLTAGQPPRMLPDKVCLDRKTRSELSHHGWTLPYTSVLRALYQMRTWSP